MRFLCDVHISLKLSKFLSTKGYISLHINQILQKSQTPDKLIAQYADSENLILITKDTDFKNSYFVNKYPKKLIRVCLGNISNQKLLDIFDNNLQLIEELNQKTDSFYLEIGSELTFYE